MSVDKRDAKRNRVETIIASYEARKKAALSNGEQFKPPSKNQIAKEAEVNKNYWTQSVDEDLKKRLEAITDKGAFVKSIIEKEAEEAVAEKERLQDMFEGLAKQLEVMAVERNNDKIEIEQLRHALDVYKKAYEQHGFGELPPVKASEEASNVTPFQVIEGDKDDN